MKAMEMAASVVVVHNERNTRELAVASLRAAGLEAIGFDDPMAALDAIESDPGLRVLVTRISFGTGKPNGTALARMARVKRPGTKVLFVAREENAPFTEDLGAFLAAPLDSFLLVETVGRLLTSPD